MTCNHAVWIIGSAIPRWLILPLYGLGGATFPIMAFMLVEGYRHTSNLKRYAGRLLLWACIAEVPFYLFLAEPESYFIFDVLFTLAMGLGLLWVRDHARRPLFWLAFVVAMALSMVCDWALVGPLVVVTYYLTNAGPAPEGRRGVLLTLIIPVGYCVIMALSNFGQYVSMGISAGYAFSFVAPELLYGLVGGGIAALLLCAYDGTLGSPLAKGSSANGFNANTLVKWGFYAYYPLHIAVLGLISLAL